MRLAQGGLKWLCVEISIINKRFLKKLQIVAWPHLKHDDSPPPHMHVSLQGEQQVGKQPLVHWRPFKFRDAEHGCPWSGAELPALLLRHGHAPETQVNTEVPFQLGRGTTVEGL